MRGSSIVARLVVGAAVLALQPACRTTGEYVAVESYPAQPAPSSLQYVLQPGDLVSVRVWNQDSVSTRARIRPDGKISVPFLEDVEAAGTTPAALARTIQSRLKDFIVNPVVTVSLEEARPLVIAVIGEVTRPGTYPMETGSGVLQALAAAGGMTPFADRDGVFVLRQAQDGRGVQRVRFTMAGLTQAKGGAAAFRLQGGDVVVVE